METIENENCSMGQVRGKILKGCPFLRAAGEGAASTLIENRKVLELLDRIVCSLASERALRQDLMQEALIHLWQAERDRPGQSTSWYLQGCRFRLRHYLAAGKSVDSAKRRGGQMLSLGDDQEATEFFEDLQAG